MDGRAGGAQQTTYREVQTEGVARSRRNQVGPIPQPGRRPTVEPMEGARGTKGARWNWRSPGLGGWRRRPGILPTTVVEPCTGLKFKP